ncbi:MAG: flagellar assembly protein FliW, partial [Bacillota bacterium]
MVNRVLIHTTRFSDIDVAEDRVIRFPEGLIGFEQQRRFALITRGNSPFMWLQSLDDPGLAFAVTDPLIFVPGYSVTPDEDTIASLEAESPVDLRYLAIAVVPSDPSQTSLNLQAPIAVNHARRMARQIVTMNPEHPLKYYVFQQRADAPSRTPGFGERRE